MTSAMINVIFLPVSENKPTAVDTEKITMRIPQTPRENLESTAHRRILKDDSRPSATEA